MRGRKLIAGNWKCNGTIPETERLLRSLLDSRWDTAKAEVVVCPPFTSLQFAVNLLKGSKMAVGAQNMTEHENGAYTGEISADMLLTVGVTHVILGHSERRQYHRESDRTVNAKVRTALRKGLIPIVCVGEELEQRQGGGTKQVIGTQVDTGLLEVEPDALKRLVIAYEPVWAIGTGKTATPEMAQEVHAFIRERMTALCGQTVACEVPILYGGSVKPDNAAELLAEPDIDGALVGGASLKAADFLAIINAA